jgi:hypothetical protein
VLAGLHGPDQLDEQTAAAKGCAFSVTCREAAPSAGKHMRGSQRLLTMPGAVNARAAYLRHGVTNTSSQATNLPIQRLLRSLRRLQHGYGVTSKWFAARLGTC